MEDPSFPGNSRNVLGSPVTPPKVEKPKKDIQKVVTGEVVQRKKSLGRRFKEVFFRGEFKGVMSYLTGDVLIPALRNMVVDTSVKGIERAVYGESYSRRRPDLGRSRISYNTPVDRGYQDRYPTQYSRDRTTMLPDQPPRGGINRRQDSGEIILVSRSEAELVVERLTDIIDQYEIASIADLHELVGLPSSFVDNKWGWTNLKGVDIRQIREGFLIDLPPVEPV